MQFETDRIKAEFSRLQPASPGGPLVTLMLLHVLTSIDNYAQAIWNWDIMLTCLLRTPEENDACYGGLGDHLTGVHVVGRGGDIRTHEVPPETVQKTADWINDQLIYDPTRPKYLVAFIEGAGAIGSTAPHLHIQCHPNTVSR